MATVAAALPRARSVRLRPALLVAAACLASVALYGWMRAGIASDLHAPFARWCRDLLEPGDWQCGLTVSDFLWSSVGGSLFIWLGLALPGVVLAATGRRASALLPVGLAGAGALVTSVVALPGGSAKPFGIVEAVFSSIGQSDAYWFVHAEAATLADLVLVAVPAAAVAFGVRPRRRARPIDLPRHAVWASTITICAAIAAIWFGWPQPGHLQYLWAPFDDILVSTIAMSFFGAMLGSDRRWWPWALVPVAVLLSFGPTAAVMSIPFGMTAFTWLADALPLFAVGFVASFWRPLATWFARRHVERSAPTARSIRAGVRPVVAINAVAAAVLIASALAPRFDPLGIRIATALPTFLGARTHAEDVRTMMNLAEAIRALEGHRADRGSYAGFDAATGETVAPALAWSDEPTGEDLVVRITGANDTSAQVVARSPTGSTFCAETSSAGVTYGSARSLPGARAACSSAPLTAHALRTVEIETLCDGIDDDAILLCRSVQRVVREILATPAPA